MSQALTTNEIRSNINSESNVKDPEVGMIFPSWDAVDNYYHAYGKQRGFGVVRAAVSYKQKAGKSTREKRASVSRCDCWGKPDKRRVSNGKRLVVESPIQKSPTNKTNSRKKCECPAMSIESQSYTVQVSAHPKYRHEELNKCSIQGCRYRKFIEPLSWNVLKNLGVSEWDVRNVIDKKKRLKMQGGLFDERELGTSLHEALILGRDENNTKVREYS
ncbi:Protein FAR1-RELATED SEQUENCE 8 [Bienertia sinuspersici]